MYQLGSTYMNGTTGTNMGMIGVQPGGGTGIYVTDTKSSFTNNADITSSGKNTTGMSVNFASITNTGNMNLSERLCRTE